MTQLKNLEFHNKIYIDSNVWFAYITKDNYDKEFFKLAKRLIDGIIDDNDSVAMISQLVYLEMINLFRVRVTQREKCEGPVTDEIEKDITNKINEFAKEFTIKTTGWISSKKLFAIKPTKSFKDVYTDVQRLQQQITGKIVYYEKSEEHNNPADRYHYTAIDHHDIQHALLAVEGNATEFATFDKSFKYVRDKFPKLRFNVMEKPEDTD